MNPRSIKIKEALICICSIIFFTISQHVSAQDSSSMPEKKSFTVSGKWLSTFPNYLASPDGRHVMHVTYKSASKQCVGVDGIDQMEFTFIYYMAFSPDSKHTAYLAGRGKDFFLVVDGKDKQINGIITQFSNFAMTTKMVGFTPDSKQVYYRDGASWHLGDKEYKYLMPPIFSPDGTRMAFCNSALEHNFVYIDGEEKPLNGVILGGQLFFSPDSKHFAFLIIKQDGLFLNQDGIETPVKGDLKADAYPHKEKKNVTLYDFSEIGIPVMQYSPDGKRFSYWGYLDRDMRLFADRSHMAMVIDGKPDSSFILRHPLVFSPDSKHYAYYAYDIESNKKAWLIYDGIKTAAEYFVPASINMAFSPDGSKLVYTGQPSEWYSRILINGVADPNHYDDLIIPVFSPTGKYLVFASKYKNRPALIVDGSPKFIDGEFVRTVENKQIFFDSDNKIHYIVRKKINNDNTEITIVEETLGNTVK